MTIFKDPGISRDTYIVTASGPNIVRIEIHVNGERVAWTEGTPEQAEATAAAILDSAHRAREKANNGAPGEIPAKPGPCDLC